MKVKIGDKIYDSEKEPIMLIMNKKDKANIENMLPEASRFCTFPKASNKDDIKAFMMLPEDTPPQEHQRNDFTCPICNKVNINSHECHYHSCPAQSQYKG